jgi:hypothetical protein
MTEKTESSMVGGTEIVMIGFGEAEIYRRSVLRKIQNKRGNPMVGGGLAGKARGITDDGNDYYADQKLIGCHEVVRNIFQSVGDTSIEELMDLIQNMDIELLKLQAQGRLGGHSYASIFSLPRNQNIVRGYDPSGWRRWIIDRNSSLELFGFEREELVWNDPTKQESWMQLGVVDSSTRQHLSTMESMCKPCIDEMERFQQWVVDTLQKMHVFMQSFRDLNVTDA